MACYLNKQASRGDFVLKAIGGAGEAALRRVMPTHVANDLGALAKLPNPLEKPPVMPWRTTDQLRSDWQPVLTRQPSKLNTFVHTGHPDGPSVPWINRMQRKQLAGMLWNLRQNKQASRGDYARKLLDQAGNADPTWVHAKEPGFGQFMQHHLNPRDLGRLNGFTTLTPELEYGKMTAGELGRLPNDAAAGLASRLRSLRLAGKFNVPRI